MRFFAAAVVALLGNVQPAATHYLWQSNDDGGEITTTLTFSESAGQPGADYVLQMIVNMTEVYARGTVNSSMQELSTVESGSALVADIPGELRGMAYALESKVPYGLFDIDGQTVLLRYWASAPAVTTPNDWFDVQDILANTFEVTLRDPYMNDGNQVAATMAKPPPKSTDSAFCLAVASNSGCCLACGYLWSEDGACVTETAADNAYCLSLEVPAQRGCCSYCGHSWSEEEGVCVSGALVEAWAAQ